MEGIIKSYLYEQKELGERAIIPIATGRPDSVVRHRSNGEERGSNSSVFISKNEPPAGHDRSDLLSKGFFDEITARDFPLRGKACFLHLKRRKWIHKTSGSVIFHDWNQVADETRP